MRYSRLILGLLFAVPLVPSAFGEEQGVKAKLARSVNPDVPVVVIDPGHGGSNLGAPGRVTGVQEKRVVLALARALERRLEGDGIKIVLTRRRDQYLTLGERVQLANAAGAVAFISLHASASAEHDRRGAEVLVAARELSEVAAARAGRNEDPVLAMRERAEARRLARRSAHLAEKLLVRLANVRPTGRAVRPAGYDVLDGLAMPSVLVQIGYLDHPVEGHELMRQDILQTIADALGDGLVDFASGRREALASAF